jgi:hypothetical protein
LISGKLVPPLAFYGASAYHCQVSRYSLGLVTYNSAFALCTERLGKCRISQFIACMKEDDFVAG